MKPLSGSHSRRATGAVLMAVAVTAGALSLVLNVSHGLEAGLAAGIAFGLADIGKIVLPVAAGMIGWSRQMRVTAAICVSVSLWSAINVYLDGAGQDLLVKQHAAVVYAEAEKEIAELDREVAYLRSLAAEAGKGGCRQNCRALREQAAQAALELSKARLARGQMSPGEISGLAATLAPIWGKKPEDIARAIAGIKALLFLVLIEVLVWLSVPAMMLLSPPSSPAAVMEGAVTLAPIAKPATRRPIILRGSTGIIQPLPCWSIRANSAFMPPVSKPAFAKHPRGLGSGRRWVAGRRSKSHRALRLIPIFVS